MGDGWLPFFGYPQAHEDDAEQAVRAGLALVEAVPNLQTGAEAPLQVRVGIATGVVLVGDLIGEGGSQEQAVVGDTPNLAARQQDMAQRPASNRRTFVFGIVLAVVVLAMTWPSYDWVSPIPPTEAIYQPQHLILY